MAAVPNITPEQLHVLLHAAISSAPHFLYNEPLGEKELQWLGKCDALLDASGALIALVNFRMARDKLNSYGHSRSDLMVPLYDAIARMELRVPASMQGAFIPPGETWNGYAALVKILQTECEDILLVDPYLNADLFTFFAPHSRARNGIRCLTAKRSENHHALLASNEKWSLDPISQTKRVGVRYASASELHDRLIILDGTSVWLISQSFKDIAKRSPLL